MAGKWKIEWKIENFSCWCEAVHGKCIESPNFFNDLLEKAELYPRGDSGQDDNMNLCFYHVRSDFIGDVSFICSDGSSICSQHVKITPKNGRVSGPSFDLKFEEVVARIGKADQKDQIALRFCIQSDTDYEQHMCTTIGVWNVSFKIDPRLITNVKTNGSKEILYFRYTSKKGKGIYINLARQGEKIQLIMIRKPNDREEKAVLVESCISMLSNDKDLVRKEEVKHVFIKGEAWVISESLTTKESDEKGIIINLRFKVINGEFIEGYNYNIKDKKVNLVPDDSTVCFCKQESSKSHVSPNQSDDSVTVLTRDFTCLFQDQDFSDIQLKCGSVTFPVHRNILSARSPVFKTMFATDMTEAASGKVDIEDLDPSTLGLFLTYLYTGAVEDLQGESALKLYYAADKYQVSSLKRECVDFLCDKMSIENVCDVLTLGDKHKDEDLTAVSRNFILNNYNGVLGSENWENFMESEPVLALKTVTYFAKKNYVGKMYIP